MRNTSARTEAGPWLEQRKIEMSYSGVTEDKAGKEREADNLHRVVDATRRNRTMPQVA
jgi:hypothetical protein